MTELELVVSCASLAAGVLSSFYVAYLVRTSGRDRPDSPDLVWHMVETAPYDRLHNVIRK
ncbi:MAG: hypothetical protein ACP5EN_14970 [Rhodovulum sp.]